MSGKVDIEKNHGVGHKCAVDQRVEGNRCVACATGSTNAAGDSPLGADTNCTKTKCAVNQYADGNGSCATCAANTFRSAGDDVTGAVKSCDLCTAGDGVAGAYAVGNGSCAACPANSKPSVLYAAAAGQETACNCDAGFKSDTIAGTCTTCPNNLQTDDTTEVAAVGAGAASSTCNKCVANYYGTGNSTAYSCAKCPTGYDKAANSDAGAGLNATTHGCTPSACDAGQGSQSGVCYDCPAGTATGNAQSALTGAVVVASNTATTNSNSACVSGACAVGHYVSAHVCVACTSGNRIAGDPTAGPDTVCA